MKKLTRVLLIHWHYFTHETISFEMLNFLTGKNASGKSTIIDAMQLVLLGDTSGSYFNKAASGKGNRSLMGYLKGELGDDEEAGYKYLRNGRFSSYIALEFFDEEKKKYFTGGCCFDVYSENDMQKLFFLYDGTFPENEFIENKVPWNIRKLREFLKEKHPNHKTTDVGRDFRTAVYGKMGGLRDRFGSILKKAVSFNPNVDIQEFISEFVCDTQQTVDISQMQENIRSYKLLEEEAKILQEKMNELDHIMTKHTAYVRAKQDEKLYSYLIEQAQKDMKIYEMELEKKNAKGLEARYQEVVLNTSAGNESFLRLQNKRNKLQAELINDETAKAVKVLEDEIDEQKKKIDGIMTEYEKATSRLTQYISNWNRCANEMLRKLEILDISGFEQEFYSRICDICKESKAFLKQIECLGRIDEQIILDMGEEGLQELSEVAKALNAHAIELNSRIGDKQQSLSMQRNDLQQEQRSLEKGIYKFPQDALDLKEAIISRLRILAKQEVKVCIVAEAAEIENDRWRNVIEGYLNTQKYYIIVPAEYFKYALRVFDNLKRERRLYSTGLVDIEKLYHKNPTADPGSLAEEIQTLDPDVRVFLDYTLGRVHKCEHIDELRQFQVAVTDEGMLYQNYVVRAMNPERWKQPAIGQGAIYRRLVTVKKEITKLAQQIMVCASAKIGIDLCSKLSVPSENDLKQTVERAGEKKMLPMLEKDMQRLRKNLDDIDRSSIAAVEKLIIELTKSISVLGKELDGYKKEQGTLEERLRVCNEETIPRLENEIRVLQQNITQNYELEWVETTGEPRYKRELSTRGNAEGINKAFPRELTRSTNTRENVWHELIELRQSYNRKYIMGYDVKSETNEIYDDAWLELSENKLPEYLMRIEDTRKKAYEQFREDFLSRLENNIRDAETQINGLNTAIKGCFFGEESFRFKIIPRPEYKRYYDMFVDPMKMDGGYNLFSEQFNLKYKEEIAELFAIITNEDSDSKYRGQSDYDKRVQMFTDFRTYLTFDLESINREGESQRLSKTMGKKSGGETQTPFYIAVLASFAQLYRTGRDKTQNTARLIIFDEAFSKMDGERIVRSIQLLRQFNFQVILAAPTEKVGDIGTLVDRNLCVLREGKRTCVKAFDPRKTEWIENE